MPIFYFCLGQKKICICINGSGCCCYCLSANKWERDEGESQNPPQTLVIINIAKPMLCHSSQCYHCLFFITLARVSLLMNFNYYYCLRVLNFTWRYEAYLLCISTSFWVLGMPESWLKYSFGRFYPFLWIFAFFKQFFITKQEKTRQVYNLFQDLWNWFIE